MFSVEHQQRDFFKKYISNTHIHIFFLIYLKLKRPICPRTPESSRKPKPNSDQNRQSQQPFSDQNGEKPIPFGAAQVPIRQIWRSKPPPGQTRTHKKITPTTKTKRYSKKSSCGSDLCVYKVQRIPTYLHRRHDAVFFSSFLWQHLFSFTFSPTEES